MNDYLDLVLGALMLYEAFVAFTKKQAMKPERAAKYTPESVAKFSVLSGISSLICAVAFFFTGLCKIGVLHVLDFSSLSTRLIFYAILIVIIVVFLLIGQFAVLKKLPEGKRPKTISISGKAKKKKEEEEDF